MLNLISFQHSLKLVTIFLFFILVLPARAESPHDYPFGSYDSAMRAAKKSGKRIFVYYGRYGCGFCDKTNKESFSSAEVRSRYIKNYELAYIDAEGGKRLRLPSGERITEQQFGPMNKIIGTPYFMFLEADGSPIFKAPGFKTIKDLIQFDDYVSKQHYKTKSFAEFTQNEGKS